MNYLEKIVSQSTVVDLDGRFDVVESDFNIEKPLRQRVEFRGDRCRHNVTKLGPLDNHGRRVKAGCAQRGGLQCLRARRGLLGRGGSVLAVTYGFRFEVRPEDEVVELQADHHSVHVCVDCLTLLTVHRRIHHMKVEKVIVEMAERRPLVAFA